MRRRVALTFADIVYRLCNRQLVRPHLQKFWRTASASNWRFQCGMRASARTFARYESKWQEAWEKLQTKKAPDSIEPCSRFAEPDASLELLSVRRLLKTRC